MFCFFFFPPTLGFQKPLFFPMSILPPSSKESRQAGKRAALVNCVYTHTTTTCLHHCTHSGQSCAGGGKEGRLYIFFFFFSFFIFILSKEGTKSQPSFKPSAAQEPPTSPKELRLCGNPDLTSSPPSTEAVLAFEQYRQKVLPKVYALLGRVKLCQDRERGTRILLA